MSISQLDGRLVVHIRIISPAKVADTVHPTQNKNKNECLDSLGPTGEIGKLLTASVRCRIRRER
jgi:hypothetical protein